MFFFLFRELNSFIDNESYLNQDQFRFWMEGILSKVANKTSNQNNQIILSDSISVRKILIYIQYSSSVQYHSIV